MGLERTVLPTSWGRIGAECFNLTVPVELLLRAVSRRDQKPVGGRVPHPSVVRGPVLAIWDRVKRPF